MDSINSVICKGMSACTWNLSHTHVQFKSTTPFFFFFFEKRLKCRCSHHIGNGCRSLCLTLILSVKWPSVTSWNHNSRAHSRNVLWLCWIKSSCGQTAAIADLVSHTEQFKKTIISQRFQITD